MFKNVIMNKIHLELNVENILTNILDYSFTKF